MNTLRAQLKIKRGKTIDVEIPTDEEIERIALRLPDVKKLPRDVEWQKTESRIVAHNGADVAPFEE